MQCGWSRGGGLSQTVGDVGLRLYSTDLFPLLKVHSKRNYLLISRNHMFPTGTLSFHASQPVRSGKDVVVSMVAMKQF